MAYLLIEIYFFYDEIFFLDEFYVWNNKKNGGIYSWFDKNKDGELNQVQTIKLRLVLRLLSLIKVDVIIR